MMKITHTYTHPCLPLILHVHKHTHTSRGTSLIALPGALPLHTHTQKQVCTGDLLDDGTHIQTHITLATLDCLHKHLFLLHVYRSIPLHTCGVTTLNWSTYFTSVQRVFLVETVVLQTVLWDILAWSARFLVLIFFSLLFRWAFLQPSFFTYYVMITLC